MQDDINNLEDIAEASTDDNQKNKKPKAHVIRRNIEDYLEEKRLKRRLTEVFDDEYNLNW